MWGKTLVGFDEILEIIGGWKENSLSDAKKETLESINSDIPTTGLDPTDELRLSVNWT